MVLFLFHHASSLVGFGYFLGNWDTEIKFFKIFHKTDRNFVFSHTTFDRMGELLRALLLIFLFIGYPADCVRTRRKQKACNTVRRCHDLQCCISTGIYQNLHHIKLIRCKVTRCKVILIALCRFYSSSFGIFQKSARWSSWNWFADVYHRKRGL